MLASPVGALIWLAADGLRPASGPLATFAVAGVVGLLGAGWFLAKFGASQPPAGEALPGRDRMPAPMA